MHSPNGSESQEKDIKPLWELPDDKFLLSATLRLRPRVGKVDELVSLGNSLMFRAVLERKKLYGMIPWNRKR